MADNSFLNMLGIAKRAGLLSEGHDAAKTAILNGRACMCIVTSDASQRLVKEFELLMQDKNCKAVLMQIPYTMLDMRKALSYKVAVITVNDAGIAGRLAEICKAQNGEEN